VAVAGEYVATALHCPAERVVVKLEGQNVKMGF
jgi:hypothetical protein